MTNRWWIYDRPLARDRLFVVSLVCGAAATVVTIVAREHVSVLVGLYNTLGGAAAGFFLAGVVGGSVRNFIRGYRGGDSPEAARQARVPRGDAAHAASSPRGRLMCEMDVAERVVRDRALPRLPVRLARGQSWPVAWHRIEGFAAVLFVQRSRFTSRWFRPRFDLLIAELAAEAGGPFVCESFGGIGPGLPNDPFSPPPPVADGLIDAQTATRIVIDDDGEHVSRHSLGWGRTGAGVTAVELRTDIASVHVPVVSIAGYFMMVATGLGPSLVLHHVADEEGNSP